MEKVLKHFFYAINSISKPAIVLIILTVLFGKFILPLLPHFNIELPWNTYGDFVVDKDDNIYLFSDYHSVLKYDKEGNFISSIPYETEYQRHDLATDITGRLYVNGTGDVLIFNSEGKLEKEFLVDKNESALLLLENGETEITKELSSHFIQSLCKKRNRKTVTPGDAIFYYYSKCSPSNYNPMTDIFIDKKGNKYSYKGILSGVIKISPNGKEITVVKQPLYFLIFLLPYAIIFALFFFILFAITSGRPKRNQKN